MEKPERLNRLRQKRTVLRASVTKLLHHIQEETSKDDVNCDRLDELLSMLMLKEKSLHDIEPDIEQDISTEELEANITRTLEYEDNVSLWRTRATRVMERAQKVAVATEDYSPRLSTRSLSSKASVKLPKLVINKYNGEVCLWQEFWDQFEGTIHQNYELTKTEKFTYLKSYLVGPAARAVAGLKVTEANYDIAVDMLKQRFGRKDLIVSAHMSKLLNLTPVKRSSDINSLRQLYDEVEVQIRSLESLGVPSDNYGGLLCPILFKMIPDDLTLEFTRKSVIGQEWGVMELIGFLQQEVESRERAAHLTKTENYKETHAAPKHYKPDFSSRENWRRFNVPSAAALHTGSSNMPYVPKCVFCDSISHKSEQCTNETVTQRKERLKKKGRCFICLKPRHIARDCRSKNVMCTICGRRHYAVLCDNSEQTKNRNDEDDTSDAVVTSVIPCQAKQSKEKCDTVLLQTVRAMIEGPTGRKSVRCLIDGGSQRSFVHEKQVKALKLPIVKREILKLHTFGSKTPVTTQCNIVKLVLENIHDVDQRIEVEAVQTPQLCTAIMKVPSEHIQQQLEKKDLLVADVSTGDKEDMELSVLIGADYYWRVVTGKTERLSEALVAVETRFGWCVQGPVAMSSMNEATCMNIGVCENITEISNQIKAFWEIESLGISTKNEETSDHTQAKESFDKSVRFIDGHYEVALPWRQDAPDLPDNKRVAQKRFETLKRKLKSDVTLFKRYNDVIEDYFKQGICEDVSESNQKEEALNNAIYYLPHHAVIREDKITTKLRVVFDASSHENDCPSLNDCLLPGPNLNPDLMSILIRFRQNHVAFTADITKAFLQISLTENDRDAVRFLWITGTPDAENTKTRLMRMTRVVFGVTSSPFLLAATVRHHLKNYEAEHPKTVSVMRDSLYVDDLIASSCTVEEAFQLTTEAKKILTAANMDLCKWNTNSPELKTKWLNSDLDFPHENEVHGNVLKVLGLVWRPKTDDFVFDLNHLMNIIKEKENTKRSVLRLSARIFDPIGFLTPFTIRVKCLFQEMWRRGLSWDDELPPDLSQEWQQWCMELLQIHQIVIPRWYGTGRSDTQALTLHVFTDASERAYGAVAYLRGKTAVGEIFSTLVASKSRVAPIKTITLPRLELMGALIGARLATNLLKALNMTLTQLYMWSDSMIVIHWVQSSSKKWKQFVANRVMEIQTLTPPELWSHCSGKINPADLTTRGQSATKLKEEKLWWSGPPFLKMEEIQPRMSEFTEILSEKDVNVELKRNHTVVHLTNTETVTLKPLLNLENYSKLQTVLRITAWIKRFVNNCRTKERKCGELTAEEITMAEMLWIREAQLNSFGKELSELKKGENVHNDSKIRDFKPFLDEHDLICLGGRLHFSDMSFKEQHPWLLPSSHRFAALVITNSHANVHHSGTRDTLVQLREKFWIPRARQLIKKCISDCNICRRFRVKAAQQTTAPLPKDRVTESPPFEVTGVDFAGPLFVKAKGSVEKAYVALFTCAVTRAVHLELVSSLSTENFLLAMKRFISRRGVCKIIYSDNAQTFKRANEDLKVLWKTIKEPELLEYFSNKGIVWKFIAERAAWWGGFWERLVRSVKGCLRRVMGRASLSFEELTSLLSEIEATINSRPLTFVYNDLQEPQPLTPAHFLVGQRLTSLPPKPLTSGHAVSANREQLTRRWKYRHRLINEFWNRWRRDYLMDLRSAHVRLSKHAAPLKEGDLVLIGDDKVPRLTWKTGMIAQLFPGRDGLVRSCTVRTPSGTILRRPVQLLYPFEVR